MKEDLVQLGGKVSKLDYSKLRKQLQKEGEVPSWYTTAGLQLFYEKYSWQQETVKSRMTSIAETMAKHAPKVYPDWWEEDAYTKGLEGDCIFQEVERRC